MLVLTIKEGEGFKVGNVHVQVHELKESGKHEGKLKTELWIYDDVGQFLYLEDEMKEVVDDVFVKYLRKDGRYQYKVGIEAPEDVLIVRTDEWKEEEEEEDEFAWMYK